MHRLGKKGTRVSHKHHWLLLAGNEGREKREGKSGKGMEGREHSYREHIISTELNLNVYVRPQLGVCIRDQTI